MGEITYCVRNVVHQHQNLAVLGLIVAHG
jgi:hypothetical protein